MAWPLVIVGVVMGVVMIMVQVRSPMLFAVGMYLPLATTFAIFVGGVLRWATDTLSEKAGHNAAQKSRVESIGILTASGLIAGEALVGWSPRPSRTSRNRYPRSWRTPLISSVSSCSRSSLVESGFAARARGVSAVTTINASCSTRSRACC